MRSVDALFRRGPKSARLELVLRGDDGPWRLTVSPGMERFIGPYPRIDGFDSGEPLLRFRVVDPA